MADNSHTIHVRSVDAFGNKSAWGSHTVDNRYNCPLIKNLIQLPQLLRLIELQLGLGNAVSVNPVSYEVRLNGGSITGQTGRTYTPSSNLSDGSHTIEVRAKDALGNTSAWGSHTVTIDTTANKPQPTTATPTTDRTPTWTWNAVSGNPVSYDVQLIMDLLQIKQEELILLLQI